ncbi:substrate-binding domain-containing protein [Streptomyces hydrogenans]|uniref:substrate-binding domain-containing protein n=1 Tax=Streptomyces hydrogenans TaxID=1873719 RepID=UPI00382F1804
MAEASAPSPASIEPVKPGRSADTLAAAFASAPTETAARPQPVRPSAPRRRRKAAVFVSTLVVLGLTVAGAVAVLSQAGSSKGGGSGALPSSISTGTGKPGCPSSSAVFGGDGAMKGVLDQWAAVQRRTCPNSGAAAAVVSGTAYQQFVARSADAIALDREPSREQAAAFKERCPSAQTTQLPIAAQPIVVTYEGIGSEPLVLDASTIARIYNGKITRWNDPAIVALNPTRKTYPDEIGVIRPPVEFAPSVSRFLAEAAPAEWPYPAGSSTWPTDVGLDYEHGDSFVTPIRILPQAEAGDWAPRAKLATSSGPVEATPETGTAAMSGLKATGTNTDLLLDVDYAHPAPGGYPLIQVGYTVFCNDNTADSHGNRPLQALVDMITHGFSTTGQQETSNLGYAPLPPELASQVNEVLQDLKPGY